MAADQAKFQFVTSTTDVNRRDAEMAMKKLLQRATAHEDAVPAGKCEVILAGVCTRILTTTDRDDVTRDAF